MGIHRYLEVDINGEQIFFVDKEILASFSGILSKLFGKLATSRLKVIFHGFPGGAEGFELVTRYCYNNGKNHITPSFNIFLLHCASNFMEMKKDSLGVPDLIDETEKCFQGIQCWTWSELLLCLKQCQDLLPFINPPMIIQKFLDIFVIRLCLLNISSPCTSSENSNSQLSCDSSSGSTVKSYISQATWWFEDLVFLNINLFEKLVQSMISQKFNHATISSFLFYYQRSKLVGFSETKKRQTVGSVINLLFLLERSSISCRGLFHLFGFALCLKINKSCKKKLENLIGSKLDQATIDDLLVPSPRGKKYSYDVNLVLRLVKSFLAENQFLLHRLKKVVPLMDLYLAEVAPDPHLKPSKFVALATALPDLARDSQDRIYLAIEMYLKVLSFYKNF
ncbi:hypothetical protein U1Q18_008982 [Sarracenia purpurea var. burkii]